MNKAQIEIKDIVSKLQELQIRQTELLDRLERLSEPQAVSRKLKIGDVVTILNPGLLQEDKSKVIRINTYTDRITVQTANGTKTSKVVRASRNLLLA
jgi:transcription antitermination factor NusG